MSGMGEVGRVQSGKSTWAGSSEPCACRINVFSHICANTQRNTHMCKHIQFRVLALLIESLTS